MWFLIERGVEAESVVEKMSLDPPPGGRRTLSEEERNDLLINSNLFEIFAIIVVQRMSFPQLKKKRDQKILECLQKNF